MLRLRDQVARFGRTNTVAMVGLCVIGLYVALLMTAADRGYGAWSAWLVGPMLAAVTLPALWSQARRERDAMLFWLLAAGLSLRFAGAFARSLTTTAIYGGGGDAPEYLAVGRDLAAGFWSGDLATGLDDLRSTNFIRFFTGVVTTLVGPSHFAVYFVYAWIGFVGLFLCYRAYTIAVPEGRNRSYARLLFFLPSLCFWPASVGKDSWMLLAIGVAMFGLARFLSSSLASGLAFATYGIWLAWLVRPHVAGLLGLAIGGGVMALRLPRSLGTLAPFVRLVALGSLVAVGSYLISQAQGFLETAVESDDVTSSLSAVATGTQIGGSAFDPIVVRTPVHLVPAAVTVLYRPFVFEARNVMSLGVSLESSFLMLLTAVRWRWLTAAVRSFRRQPFVAGCLAYVVMFVVAFSSIANYGILARQRIQVLPMFLLLLSIPPIVDRRHGLQKALEV